jgi:cytochrome c-type biogenesis protein
VSEAVSLIILPIGLGLLGFVEPCTIGSSMLFLHYLEGRNTRQKIAQTIAFAIARGALMGLLGAIAVLLGALFVDFQKAAWAAMGAIYIGLGAAYLTGGVDRLKRSFGIGLGRMKGTHGAVALGLLFAFNIPACAGPLLVALLGAAALAPVAEMWRGFIMLGLFGLALSLPIAVAAFSERGGALLDRIARYSSTAPKVIGLLFILLGAWSIRFALVARVL